jgi:predicted SAM-dependent methyltransferase
LRKIALLFFSHRLLSIARWDIHFLLLRLKNRLIGQRKRINAFLQTRQRPLLLNLGSGPRGSSESNWLNVDGFRDRNVHFVIDFGRPLPFADATFDGVFCEHVVEHFTLTEGQRLCAEVARVLKPGGWFRVIVPDAERIMRCYFDEPNELVSRRGGKEMTSVEAVNSYFRQGYEHQFLYDWKSLEKMLLAAEFSQVVRMQPRSTRSSLPITLDDPKYFWESLYAEALKK